LVGLTKGAYYQFKVRAKNVYGYGPFSSVVSVRASEVPTTMNTVATAQVMKTIIIGWINPSDDGGEEIDLF
jgi:hypothetical protein